METTGEVSSVEQKNLYNALALLSNNYLLYEGGSNTVR